MKLIMIMIIPLAIAPRLLQHTHLFTVPPKATIQSRKSDDDSHVFVEAVEHDFPDEPYEENKISPRESSQSVTSQTDESPEPNSKPATPCFDFNYPG
ncbi:hypothetical protein N7450_004260 [Penicillium hetheringtonii]|uniref:Uncharacterized protein n=1 Tax=Penicillium hetheringtonii TaxID=911720 RepID=A0AAD6DPM6_9EURO|nr:hypothetical protein N7450_004260 [Penicillium hetheringtonii]